MFRILIVDDEYNVREGLKYLINWEENGFSIADDAQNGKAALDCIRRERPHLVITDVRMPVMDGLELLAHIRTDYQGIRVIILSGYSDFSYARSALKGGADDYLLKPVDEDELVSLLERMRFEIEKDIVVKQKEHIVSPMIRDKLLNDIAKGTKSGTQIENLLQLHGFELERRSYMMILLEPDAHGCNDYGSGEDGLELEMFVIRNISEEILQKWSGGYVFADTQTRTAVLLTGDGQEDLHTGAVKFIEELQPLISETLRTTFSFGVGCTARAYEDISRSYHTALGALEERFFLGKSHVTFYDDLKKKAPGCKSNVGFDVKPLLNSVKTSDVQSINELIDAMFVTINDSFDEQDDVKGYFLNVMIGLSKMIDENAVDTHSLLSDASEFFGIISEFRTIHELREFFSGYCIKLTEILADSWETTPREVISRTLEYINEHYSEDISLKQISNNVFLCQSYLGKLFKQATGENFNDYLTRVRIEKAQQLMKSDMKVYEIAQKVGYKSIDYFRKQFKLVAGIGPLEYRDMKRNKKRQ